VSDRWKDNDLTLYVYICKGIAGAPKDDYGISIDMKQSGCQEKHIDTWEQHSYWMLVFEDHPTWPDIVCNIWFEGNEPSDRTRDNIALGLQSMIGTVIFGVTPNCPNCHSDDITAVVGLRRKDTGRFEMGDHEYICLDCGWSFSVIVRTG